MVMATATNPIRKDSFASSCSSHSANVLSSRDKRLNNISGGDQRRLVEYFLIVSVEPDESVHEPANGDGDLHGPQDPDKAPEMTRYLNYQPVITSRYPLKDHADHPFSESLMSFCLPTGEIIPLREPSMPKVHFFVTTGVKGQQMYGTCLTLYEPCKYQKRKKTMFDDSGAPSKETHSEDEVYVPKVLCLLSAWPYLPAFREFLTQLHRLTKSGTMTVPVERYIINFCAEIPAPPPGSFEVQTTINESVIKLWSPPHNQPIAWVSLPFSHLFQCLDLNNIMLVWHALALERQVLLASTQLTLLTTCAETLLSLLFPMRWSHAYIPVLPPFMIPILSAPMPYLCGLDKGNLPKALLDLSPECIVVDLDKNHVTMGPMTPALPALPFQHNQAVRQKLEESAGMVFREVRCLSRNQDPSNMGQNLPAHVRDMAEASWEGNLCLFDEAFHLYFTPEEARKNLLNGDSPDYAHDWNHDGNIPLHIRVMSRAERQKLKRQSNWDSVQECFLSIYMFMLRNYRKYLVFPTNSHEAGESQSHDASNYTYGGFRTKAFIQSQRRDMQPFLTQLCATQQFDNFVTKRLYGSGEADVIFFDQAIRKAYADPNRNRRGSSGFRGAAALRGVGGIGGLGGIGGVGFGMGMFNNDRPPLLQSAGVRRKLKTIVPPEPSSVELPPQTQEMRENVTHFMDSADGNFSQDDDDVSVITTQSASSYSARSSQSGVSPKRNRKSLNKPSVYVYPTFPETLDATLFGTPRPLPSAVLAEFDRQRADAARFRRKVVQATDDAGSAPNVQVGHVPGKDNEIVPTAEVATFTLFFMTFTALVGQELMDVTDNVEFEEDKTILSTYVPPSSSSKHVGTQGEEATVADTTETNSVDNPDGGEQLSDDDRASKEEKDQASEEGSTGSQRKSDKDDDVVDLEKQKVDEQGGVITESSEGEKVQENDKINGEDSDEVEASLEHETEPAKENGSNDKSLDSGNENHQEENSEGDNPLHQHDDDDNSKDINPPVDQEWTSDPTQKKSDREELPGSISLPGTPQRSNIHKSSGSDATPLKRNRFHDTLSTLKIEEAKATAKAQLGLAFDILHMMRERGLKADPAAYQCLIEACGRCGDTDRATQLLSRMHKDGIAADGVVYSCLVSSFSAENSWKRRMGNTDEDLPEWANGTTMEMDWNNLRRRSYMDVAKEKLTSFSERLNAPTSDDDEGSAGDAPKWTRKPGRILTNLVGRKSVPNGVSKPGVPNSKRNQNSAAAKNKNKEIIVTEPVLMQILLGENLLELIYPDVSIDMEEYCPRCNKYLSDNEIVCGWISSDSQNYTTTCPTCQQKFVPHFSVDSTSPSFVGSKGPSSPLFCERLSPWVLQKELRTIMGEKDGIKEFLKPGWREKEARNATLWWNLVISYMRYRLPVSFLLQGNFETNLIAPTPNQEG